MNVIIFGVGKFYHRYKKWFKNVHIVALLDNDSSKWGLKCDDLDILSPEIGVRLNYDAIFILSIYSNEIRKQLQKMGVEKKEIFDQNQICEGLCEKIWVSGIQIYIPKRDKRNDEYICDLNINDTVRIYSLLFGGESLKSVLLISHGFNFAGGDIALFYMAIMLKKRGYKVCVAGYQYGILAEKYLNIGIQVLVDENLQVRTLEDEPYITFFSMVIVNTITMHTLLRRHKIGIPILWWLHDAEIVYKNCNDDLIAQISGRDIVVCSVGMIATDPFLKRNCNFEVKELSYGVMNIEENETDVIIKRKSDNEKEKMIFAIIGSIVPNKAQNIFIDAINKLDERNRSKCNFLIVGKIMNEDSLYIEDVMKKIGDSDDIFFVGELEHEKILQLYQNIDVMVVPSYNDSLPITSVEAMMNHRPSIISTGAGTSKYITPYLDGLVCEPGNAVELAKKMTWMIEHKNKLRKMGNEAYKIYTQNFSMTVFEKKYAEIEAYINKQMEI